MSTRVTLISGASSGIGAATARLLAAPDECLCLHARGGVDGQKISLFDKVADDARAAGAEVQVVTSDLAEPGNARAWVDFCIDRFGRIDRIVSNAGYALATPVGELSREALCHSYRLSVGAFLELVDAALPLLQQSDAGRVVAVSSFVVNQAPGGRLFPATSAAKGALQALAMSLAAQLAADGITVNCVAPGFTRKEAAAHSALSTSSWTVAAALTPNRRLAQPLDIAHAIEFLLSHKASHITGQTLRVDGGLSLV